MADNVTAQGANTQEWPLPSFYFKVSISNVGDISFVEINEKTIMNKIILLSFLWLICFTNNAIHAENSFKTYFGKVYSIGDTITIGRNNGYIYEFDNSQTRTIKQNLSGKKLTISQFYNIKITDNIVEQYLKLCITPKEYGRIQSDPFIMSDIRKKYRAKLNEAIN